MLPALSSAVSGSLALSRQAPLPGLPSVWHARVRRPISEVLWEPPDLSSLPGLTGVETEAELSSAWQFVLKLKPELADPGGNIKQASSRVSFISMFVTEALGKFCSYLSFLQKARYPPSDP